MYPNLKLMMAGLSCFSQSLTDLIWFFRTYLLHKIFLLCFVGYDSECDLCDASACFSTEDDVAVAFILNQTSKVKFVNDKTYFIHLSLLPNICVNAHARFPRLS